LTGVLIAEPSYVLRLGIKSVLAEHSSISITAEVTSKQELLSALAAAQHDIILIELKFFQSVGISAFKYANHASAAPKVLVHSYTDSLNTGIAVLKSGGMGYLTKHCSPSELKTAILTLAAGKPYISELLLDELANDICFRPSNLPHLKLTSRELQVFKMLVVGMSVSAIAVQLDISSKTISTYKVRIIKKMQLPRISELVQYAIANKLL
jgi:DNA-binding NarL/FixJ family response regulator